MQQNHLHNQLLSAGLHYLSLGFPIIPVMGKHPLISWKEYQLRCPTPEELQAWFKRHSTITGIALVTGPISNVAVLDVEHGEDVSDLNLPTTASTATGGGGYHFFFKYPTTDITNTVRLQGRRIDIRGKGGLIILPPSLHPSGNSYKELVALTPDSLAELPENILNLITHNDSNCIRDNTQDTIQQGSRNDYLTRVLGKMLKNFPSEQWDSTVLPELQRINTDKCQPPLATSEVLSIYKSITARAISKTIKPSTSPVMEYLMEKLAPSFNLFVDQNQDVFLFENNSLEPIVSRIIRQRLKLTVFNAINKHVSDEQIKNFTDLLIAKTLRDHSKRFVSAVRVSGSISQKVLYDLADQEGNIVVITKDQYTIEKNTQPLFRRYIQHIGQTKPLLDGNTHDLNIFDDLLHFKSEEDKTLFKWYIVSLFIPGFAHPMLLLRGDQGSGKSTLCRLINSLVDPTRTPLLTFPRNDVDFSMIFDRNWLVAFDNIDHLPHWGSDSLCVAITGGSMQTRELYTNNEVIIRSIQNPIILNGIDITNMKSDLTDRSIILELERIPAKQRMTEKDYYDFLEAYKAKFLAAIFTIVSKTMSIFPQLLLKEPPRMADFAHVLVAVAIATGSSEEEALRILKQNSDRQHEAVIGESPLAQKIIELIDQKSMFEGSPTDLLKQLQELAGEDGKKELPQRANGLSRKLNKLKATLIDYGISIDIGKDQFGIRGRYIRILKAASLSTQLTHDQNVVRVRSILCVDTKSTTENNTDAVEQHIDASTKECYDDGDKSTNSLDSDNEINTIRTNNSFNNH